MRKIFFIVTLLLLFGIGSTAQTYLLSSKGQIVKPGNGIIISDGAIYLDTTGSIKAATNGYVDRSVSNAGNGVYTGASPTNVTVGGLSSGTDISGLDLGAIIEKMVVAYLAPAFSSFTISGVSQSQEVGTSITGSKTFTWSISNQSNAVSNTLSLTDVTTSTTLASSQSLTPPITRSLTVTNNSPASHTWRVSATNTNSQTFSADFTVSWYYSRYWGWSMSSTPTNGEILANSSELTTGRGKSLFNIAVSGSDRHVYFAYPASFGDLTSIVVGGFESINSFTKNQQTITNAQGVSATYNVYVSNNVFSVDVNNIVTQ